MSYGERLWTELKNGFWRCFCRTPQVFINSAAIWWVMHDGFADLPALSYTQSLGVAFILVMFSAWDD